MNAQVHGLSREQTDARMDEILAFAEIGDFIDEPVKTYSSGMYVRLAFAVIAHVDADILIIDEALAVGDAMFTHKCMRFLRAFMREGTVLFVSHDTSAIKSLCSRAIWIEKGTKLMEGSPKEICDLYLQAFYEEQQGKSSATVLKKDFAAAKPVEWRDQRLDFINRSDFRNDIRIFEFDPNAQSFGAGGAKIRDAHITDRQGQPLAYVVGGETVILRVTIDVNEDLDSPIVGFYVKDRLGQTLFGDNTFMTYADAPVPVAAGQDLVAEFEFPMPVLLVGSYSIHLAVADGTQQEHVQQHFFHDALLLQSEASSRVNGLVGIPMRRIELVVQPHPTLATQ